MGARGLMLQHSQAVPPSDLGRTQELGSCPPISVAVSKLWPLSFWFCLVLRVPGAQTLAYSLFVLSSCLVLQPETSGGY